MTDRACIICLETSPRPIRLRLQLGCACRGVSGLAHVSCVPVINLKVAVSQQGTGQEPQPGGNCSGAESAGGWDAGPRHSGWQVS